MRLAWNCLIAGLICFTISPGWAASLKVSPARFLVQDIVPGRLYDIYKETGLRLTVYNDSDTTRTFALSTDHPSQALGWEQGYTAIPDPKWCWFKQAEVTVSPHGQAPGELMLQLPEGGEYQNLKTLAVLRVSQKPGGGARVGVAIEVRAQFETRAAGDVKPIGELGIAPATVQISDEASTVVKVFNNSEAEKQIAVVDLHKRATRKLDAYISSGCDLVDRGVKVEPETLRVPAGGSADLRISTDASSSSRKLEALYLVEPENREKHGSASLLRIQVIPRTAREAN